MDKSAIKNFAVWARKKLIEDIKQKAYEIGITEKEIKEPEVSTSDTMIIGDRSLNKIEIAQRKSLVSIIKEKGFNNVIEEVAYTWFNRFIALRFMEVNEYLPTGVRVLSSLEPGKKEPDIIKEALNIDLDIDRELVYRLQDGNETEVLYRYLLVKQCNVLNEILPGLFEKIEDYTEILLPFNLLTEGSVISKLVEEIEEEDFKQEEIIGWFYQFYNQEKRNIIFDSNLSDRKKILKNDIPAATQIFTPKWIVQYIVQNSLGKLWLESHPNEELKAQWNFYIEEAELEHNAKKQLNNSNLNPEDIKVLDPAMGSGHILVYAFDVLYNIYLSAGYSEREIPTLILEKNLYGLEIDDRAAQLATFSLLMKARSKDRRIFRHKPKMNLCSIQESNNITKEAIEYLVRPKKDELEKQFYKEDIEYLINVFHDAKEYGSILEVKEINYDALEKRIEEIRNNVPEDIFELQYRKIILEKIPPLIQQAIIMSQKYDVVCTNPPYLSNNRMNNKIQAYASNYYDDVKSDLFAIFIKKSTLWTLKHGFIGLVTPYVWWFISSYENLREYILQNTTISTLIQLEYNAFEGATIPVGTFVLRNYNSNYEGIYIKLSDFKGIDAQPIKTLEAISNPSVYYRYKVRTNDFSNIPGKSFAYWLSKKAIEVFSVATPLEKICYFITKGIFTGNNQKFIRFWFEISSNGLNHNRWNKYSKGGAFRRWYGNISFAILWENNNGELRNCSNSGLGASKYFNLPHIVWSKITNSYISFRYNEENIFFDDASPAIIFKNEVNKYILGVLNSKVIQFYLNSLSPTMNNQIGDIRKLPIINKQKYYEKVWKLVEQNIAISKTDWDLFETSWDFKLHPLITYRMAGAYAWGDNPPTCKISSAFKAWSVFTEGQYNQLKTNEEELNRIFIEIYGLQDELTPDVEEKDVTVHRVYNTKDDIPESMKGSNYALTREDVIKSFISYAVGCMFGRYSIDAEGLIYAGGDFKDKWKCENGQWKVRKIVKDEEGKVVEDTWVDATFVPDMDNVLPITDDEYFEDDIVSRFIEFLKVTFGEDTLKENLDYIADTLGRKSSETARQAIRRYFLKDFYKDHVQVYQKKPIYWLFDSGKQDGFKALIYMHRYDEFTVARVRTDYLHKLQKSYEAEIKRLDIIIDSNVSQREKTNARKKKEKILKQMEECLQYDQVIAHIANQRIKIDLDDGVSVNYSKFQGVEVPQGEGRKPLKADLLAKI
jgi:type II restriction/modification system DNA methylase subunit YeeA